MIEQADQYDKQPSIQIVVIILFLSDANPSFCFSICRLSISIQRCNFFEFNFMELDSVLVTTLILTFFYH